MLFPWWEVLTFCAPVDHPLLPQLGGGQCKPQPWARLLALKEGLLVFPEGSEGLQQPADVGVVLVRLELLSSQGTELRAFRTQLGAPSLPGLPELPSRPTAPSTQSTTTGSCCATPWTSCVWTC